MHVQLLLPSLSFIVEGPEEHTHMQQQQADRQVVGQRAAPAASQEHEAVGVDEDIGSNG